MNIMKHMSRVMPEDINKYFYNRKRELKILNTNLSMLEEGITNQFLITGFRGIGKTIFLRKLLEIQPENFLTTYIDLSELYGREKGDLVAEDFIKELLCSIEECVEENDTFLEKAEKKIIYSFNQLKLKDYNFNNKSLRELPIPVVADNYNVLSKYVMELPQNIVDTFEGITGFIIVIDEFQLLKSVKNPEALFWLIKSFTQRQHNVCYIFTGSISNTYEIVEMMNGETGAFGGQIFQLKLNGFTKQETKIYIEGKASYINMTPKAFDLFYEYSRGIPRYINSLCSILPNNMVCTEEIFEKSFRQNIDNLAVLWISVWGSLSDDEKELIIYLVVNGKMNLETVLTKISTTEKELIKLFDSLTNKGIIGFSTDSEYYISDIMLKRWLELKYETGGTYPY